MSAERLAEWLVTAEWRLEADDDHHLALGRLLARLQAIEAMTRLALYDLDERAGAPLSAGIGAFAKLKAGDAVISGPEDAFEAYDALRTLLTKFNAAFQGHTVQVGLVVGLRDGLAHGRSFPVQQDGATFWKVIKFGRARPFDSDPGSAPSRVSRDVEFAAILNEKWCADVGGFLAGETARVRAAARGEAAPTNSICKWDGRAPSFYVLRPK